MKAFLALILFFSLSYSYCQENTIYTDRPNVTDAVAPIPKGTFQVELGYSGERTADDITFSTFPNYSFKYGLFDWLELRLIGNYQSFTDESENLNISEDGFSPLTFSPKIKVTEQTNWIPRFSLATSFTFPDFGAEAFQINRLNYGFRLLLENERGLPWSGSFGVDRGDFDETTWAYSWTSGGSFTDSFGFFFEFYGFFANDIDSRHSIDGGLTYLINNNLTTDVIIGLGLTEAAPDLWWGFGLAWKTGLTD